MRREAGVIDGKGARLRVMGMCKNVSSAVAEPVRGQRVWLPQAHCYKGAHRWTDGENKNKNVGK